MYKIYGNRSRRKMFLPGPLLYSKSFDSSFRDHRVLRSGSLDPDLKNSDVQQPRANGPYIQIQT